MGVCSIPTSAYLFDLSVVVKRSKVIGTLGAVIDGRILVGIYCNELVQDHPTQEQSTKQHFLNKLRNRYGQIRYGHRFVPYFYEYERLKRTWLPVLPKHTNPLVYYHHDIDGDLVSYVSENSILVGLHVYKHKFMLASMGV